MSSANTIITELSDVRLFGYGVRQDGMWMRGTGATTMSEATGILVTGNALATDSARSVGRNTFGAYYLGTSSAVIGANVGQTKSIVTGGSFAREIPQIFKMSFGLGRVTDIRCFAGLSATSTLGSGIDADNLTAQSFGLQFSTVRGDTSWQLVSYNGTTQTTTATGLAPAANALVELIMWWIDTTTVNVEIRQYSAVGAITYYTGTITATMPASTTDLVPNHGAETRTAVALGFYQYGVRAYTLSI